MGMRMVKDSHWRVDTRSGSDGLSGE